jgi:hypothetical protein
VPEKRERFESKKVGLVEKSQILVRFDLGGHLGSGSRAAVSGYVAINPANFPEFSTTGQFVNKRVQMS